MQRYERPKVIIPGCEIFVPHGEKIGVVAEVRGDRFRVAAPLMPDYWLSEAAVDFTDEGRVTLKANLEDLDEYRVKESEAA
jgi:hypothetical protein